MNLLIAAISGSGLVNALVYLLIAGIILGLVLWLVNKSPVPEPFKSVIVWIVYLVAVLVLINFLLSLIGRPFITF
jgi:predicted membrane channel-forming protein YqfA (hemolysin III family)